MNKDNVTPREKMDIHEIMMFKVLCGTKSSTMQALVQDEVLKNMLSQDVTTTQNHLRELRELIQPEQQANVETT